MHAGSMRAMDPEQPIPAAGEMVTVTFTDPTTGKAWAFHGRMGAERYTALTVGTTGNQWGWEHLRDRGTTAAREWVRVEHAIVNHQYTHKTPFRGRNWQYGLFGLDVCLAPDSGVSVAPITDEGRDWLTTHETAPEKRDRLLARFAALDPEAAAELETVITDLIDEAREAAEDAWSAHVASLSYDD